MTEQMFGRRRPLFPRGDRMIPRVSGDDVRAPFAMLPLGGVSETRLLLAARGVRAVGDGFISLLLPVYLLELGHGPFETGVIATATLAGSATSHPSRRAGRALRRCLDRTQPRQVAAALPHQPSCH